MNRRNWIAGGALAACIVVAGSTIAVANRGKGTDHPLSGNALDRAAAAALAHTGGGTVVESDVGDAGVNYSVEVRLDDGSSVEVRLDQNFNVIGSQHDEDGANGPQDQGSSEN
jgi:hypothetical protein